MFTFYQGYGEKEANEMALQKFPKLNLTRRQVLLEILERKGIDPDEHYARMPSFKRCKCAFHCKVSFNSLFWDFTLHCTTYMYHFVEFLLLEQTL